MHHRSIENNGPHATARNELKAVQKKQHNEINDNPFIDEAEKTRQLTALKALHTEQSTNLYAGQRQFAREFGDPDAPAKQRKREARERREVQARILHNEAVIAGLNARIVANGGVPGVARPPPVGQLAAFATDNQNVHTTHAVQQTKDIVNKILEIHVPDEYRWNMKECSKTPGEIIAMCKLSPNAAWQMTSKYCQAEEIYEMGAGIYGRVLDCVWQFILSSPDKDDLTKIVKTEMKDNIGMCAQGNLSRLCNILSGYLDGIIIRESPAEIIGRLIADIIETNDLNERAKKMVDALIEARMPREKWDEWIDPAFEGVSFTIVGNKIQIMA